MQRADRPQAAALAAEIQAFVSQNLSLVRRGSSASQAWFQALREHRWYVPHWPAAFGGLDWSPYQTYLWQRELSRAQALLPPQATTHLLASWIFRWLPQQRSAVQAQGRRWLAGIAGEAQIEAQGGLEFERWRVGVDLRRPDWPSQALAHQVLYEQAHWVLQPYRQKEGAGLGDGPGDVVGDWAIGVLPGALLSSEPGLGRGLGSPGAEKLNPDLSPKTITEVELGVEQHWPPILSGLSLAEVEVLLRPIQLGGQDHTRLDGAAGAPSPGLLVPSIGLGLRLERLQQVLEAGVTGEAALEKLHTGQIALVALQVLEARAVQGEPMLAGAALAQAVSQSAERLSWQVAELEADTLGYFALPVFDEELQHNEGPVTPALYDPLIR